MRLAKQIVFILSIFTFMVGCSVSSKIQDRAPAGGPKLTKNQKLIYVFPNKDRVVEGSSQGVQKSFWGNRYIKLETAEKSIEVYEKDWGMLFSPSQGAWTTVRSFSNRLTVADGEFVGQSAIDSNVLIKTHKTYIGDRSVYAIGQTSDQICPTLNIWNANRQNFQKFKSKDCPYGSVFIFADYGRRNIGVPNGFYTVHSSFDGGSVLLVESSTGEFSFADTGYAQLLKVDRKQLTCTSDKRFCPGSRVDFEASRTRNDGVFSWDERQNLTGQVVGAVNANHAIVFQEAQKDTVNRNPDRELDWGAEYRILPISSLRESTSAK